MEDAALHQINANAAKDGQALTAPSPFVVALVLLANCASPQILVIAFQATKVTTA